MKKLLTLVIALSLALSTVSCSNSSSSKDVSSSDTSTSTADSSVNDKNADSSSQSGDTTTTTTSATKDTEYSYDTEATSKPSSQSETTTRDTTPPPAPVGTDLKKIAQEVFNAKQLDLSGDPSKTFRDACDKGAGEYSLVADIKTSELFDPFDDLYLSSSQKAMESAKPDAQIFIYGNSYDVEEDQTDTESDGMIYALAFNCKDEAEAKQLYSLVFTEEMKQNALTDEDKPSYDFGTDHAIVKFKDHYGENVAFCYYRAGNNVFAAAEYTVDEAAFRELNPKNYTKQADYDGLLDKLCKAFGAEKLPSSLKLQ